MYAPNTFQSATHIREILKTEAEALFNSGSYGASEALLSFARQATPEQLQRFKQVITETDQADWVNDRNNPMSVDNY